MARKNRRPGRRKPPEPSRRKLPADPSLAKLDRIAREDDRWRKKHGMKPFDMEEALALLKRSP